MIEEEDRELREVGAKVPLTNGGTITPPKLSHFSYHHNTTLTKVKLSEQLKEITLGVC